jgi:hypothetical protein
VTDDIQVHFKISGKENCIAASNFYDVKKKLFIIGIVISVGARRTQPE